MENDVPRISSSNRAARQQAIQRKQLANRLARQVATTKDLNALQNTGFDVVFIRRFSKSLEEHRLSKKTISKSQFADDEVEVVEEIKNLDETAARFNKKNFELKIKTLLILRDSISDADSIEDILKKVLAFYPDYTLADDALDFLLGTTKGNLAIKVRKAKDFLNENYKREIVAGRNINFQAQIFSKEGLGSPTNLRDLYRDITGNPRTAFTLFEELSTKYPFEKMRFVIRFLLHSLGADLKSKGPSITRAELTNLMEDAQLLQAILGVYRFFYSRSSLIRSQFDHFGLIFPKTLTFEMLSQLFINLLKEKYIIPEKILSIARQLGLQNELSAQIIIYTQMRDAIRQTSGKLYKSNKKRQEILDSFIETLEELEEKFEEEEE